MIVVILLLMLGLAAANGANDVSKGVATLAGAGITRYRTAIVWGSAATLAGAVLSIQLGHAMGKLFSSGIISAKPTNAFTLAALIGTASWVTLATVARLPVSTTHALIGSLVGAGLVFASHSVEWHGLLAKVITPLLLSIVVAGGISVLLSRVVKSASKKARGRTGAMPRLPEVTVPPTTGAPSIGGAAAGPVGAEAAVQVMTANPAQVMTANPVQDDAAPARRRPDRVLTVLHWFSSGATCCARALNDTPKIAAVGGFALLPAGFSVSQVALLVGGAMAAGSLLGIRVAKTLGEKVVHLSHGEGFRANAITAALVGFGATLALPMSTTQVSASAIAGATGGDVKRLNGKTLRDFALAWTITPVFAGLVAAAIYFVIR